MKIGTKLKARQEKFGAWREGDLGVFEGSKKGHLVVDFHGRRIRYASQNKLDVDWVEKESKPKKVVEPPPPPKEENWIFFSEIPKSKPWHDEIMFRWTKDWSKPQSSEDLHQDNQVLRELTLDAYLAGETSPAKRAQAQRLAVLMEDLRFFEYPNGLVRMCSRSVNDQVDSMDIDKSLDLYNTKPVVMWLFCKLTDGAKVFSDPPDFVVGHGKDHGIGYDFDEMCMMEMSRFEIPEPLQQRVRGYMFDHRGYYDDIQYNHDMNRDALAQYFDKLYKGNK